MTTKELIRAEIERQMKYYDEKEQKAWDGSERGNEDALWYQGHQKMCAKLLSFLDNLPDEPVMDCHDLTEAKEEYLRKARMTPGHEWMTRDIEDAFIAGAEWQYQKDRGEFAKLKAKEWLNGYDEGYAKGLNARKDG